MNTLSLSNAEIGKVRVRFATEPRGRGYLRIVDANAAILSKLLAERYEGELIVRFDDTYPAEGSNANECVSNILKDLETLRINYEKVTYTSDYFPDLMLMTEKLIRQGKAYVDEENSGGRGISRNQSVYENSKLWHKEMVVGTEMGLKCFSSREIRASPSRGS